MEGVVLVALVIAIPVVLFPVAFIWYLNISGMAGAYRRARAERKAEVKPQ
jgi:hypothetical protein